MLPFESKQIVPGEQNDFMAANDVTDVRVSFEVLAVIAFFIACATLFGLAANVF